MNVTDPGTLEAVVFTICLSELEELDFDTGAILQNVNIPADIFFSGLSVPSSYETDFLNGTLTNNASINVYIKYFALYVTRHTFPVQRCSSDSEID